MYAEVLVEGVAASRRPTFTYAVPPALRPLVGVGRRVLVPFGRSHRQGYLLGLDAPALPGARPITRVLDTEEVLTPDLLRLAEWMAEHYACSLESVLRAVLPAPVRKPRQRMLVPAAGQEEGRAVLDALGLPPGVRGVMEALWDEGEMSLARARRLAGDAGWLHVLEEAGLLVDAGAPGMRRRSLAGDVYALADAAAARDMLETWRRRAPRQAEVVDLLLQQGEVAAEALEKAVARASLQALVSRGVVIRRGRGSKESPLLPLTAEQGEAIAHLCRRLEAGEPATVLLFGITGSGKTEVYLRAVEHARSLGLQSVVLVPEIALTEHMVDVYAQRLGQGLSVLHSRQSEGERHETWQRIRRGEVDVVLGPRSAVFAPFPRPGLFVVDEEHEHSYKQDTVPRYHAREVAERRAREHRALVVLGSATPSLETFYRARSGLIQHLHLAQRAGGQPPPRVEVVDMREEFRQGNRTIFSRLLRDRLAQCLQREEQAILFLNRRGYFTHLACRECGLVVTCPHCAIPLAYHQQGEHLRCHYCGLVRREVPDRCPRCGSGSLRRLGRGTQRVEEEVLRLFPEARVRRMDADSTRGRGSHRQILQAVARREVDVLVGTQMVAKGLDFPSVSLVGVVLADTVLHLPDFRAGEKAFQLLAQVAGRAGRAELPGQVVIQTYNPDSPAVRFAAAHDYQGFYEQEIHSRYLLGYPPFSRLVRVVVSGQDERVTAAAAAGVARTARELLAESAEPSQVLGPGPCPLPLLRGRFRFQVLLKGGNGSLLTSVAGHLRANGRAKHVRIDVDVDPVSML